MYITSPSSTFTITTKPSRRAQMCALNSSPFRFQNTVYVRMYAPCL